MGDLSELRGLLTVVTFLGIFVVLIGLIPLQFLLADQGGREVAVPEIFESIDIYSFAETITVELNETHPYYWLNYVYRHADIDLGGWDIFLRYSRGNMSVHTLQLFHVWYEWIIFPADHSLEWFNYQSATYGELLSLSEMEQDGDNNLDYRAVCGHTTYYVQIAYNETEHSSLEVAWDAGELYAFFGVNFDDTNTTINAWNLISLLLFFQLPNTHWVINLMLNIPLWVCIAYLTFILILRAIEALPFT